MAYKVIFSDLAEEQQEAFVKYLYLDKGNPQAARNLISDVADTKESLSLVAGSLSFCKDPALKAMGYRIMFFRKHRYLWIYQIKGDIAEVKAMYHMLQDYENTFKSEAL